LSLAMYSSDGSFTTCGGYKALPPIAAIQEVGTEASPGYGRWAATSDREIRLTFYAIIWKEGLGNGYQRVQETLAMSEPGDEYTGHAQVDFLDANWNVVFSTTSDVEGTRLETPATLMAQPVEKKQLFPRDRIPAGTGDLGLVGLRRRVRGRRPSGLFGCKRENCVQHQR
jgi:hypothetical protein